MTAPPTRPASADRHRSPRPGGLVRRPGTGHAASTDHASRPSSSRAPSTPSSPSRRGSTTTRCCGPPGTPTAMQWFCGGHGVCLTAGRRHRRARAGHPGLAEALRAARHLGRHRPGLRVRRPERHHLLGPVLPGGPRRALHRPPGSGTLPLVATGGSGPVTSVPAGQELGQPGGPDHPGAGHQRRRRPGAVPHAGGGRRRPAPDPHLLGHRPGRRPADPGLRPAGRHHHRPGPRQPGHPGRRDPRRAPPTPSRVPLEIVAYTATPSSHVELQLVATTVAYATPQLGGSVHLLRRSDLALPVASTLTPRT